MAKLRDPQSYYDCLDKFVDRRDYGLILMRKRQYAPT